MKLIILFGPHAVGKMTVGQALSELSGIPLFHNHESIELALRLIGDHASWGDLSNAIRDVVFKHVSSAHQKGLIFTFMWALDEPSDHNYINHLEDMFINEGGEVYFVELCADQNIRLARNQTENRLKHKPSKRNIAASEERFIRLETKYRLNSSEGEIKKKNYLKIDNSNETPEHVAKHIMEYFRI